MTQSFSQRPTGPRTVELGNTGVATSALGLGCADLYREPSARRRRQVLEAAHAYGIRHFDVAPMYGLGLAEREVGRFARTRREDVIIATKFGIAPTPAARTIARVQAPARRLFSAFPALRQRARENAPGPGGGGAARLLYRASGFGSAAARLSLQRSLRELRTDYIDLFLFHDPQPDDVQGNEVCEYLEEAQKAGYIRSWGVAGEPAPTRQVTAGLPTTPPVVQVRQNVLEPVGDKSWVQPSQGVITFGVLGPSVARIVDHVASDPDRARLWQEKLGSDCRKAEVVARLLLQNAVRENSAGTVLFSTVRIDHLRESVDAVAAVPLEADPELDAFVELIRAELGEADDPPRAEL